jgi:hypothetical protein
MKEGTAATDLNPNRASGARAAVSGFRLWHLRTVWTVFKPPSALTDRQSNAASAWNASIAEQRLPVSTL